jgi:hypothetical protein
MSTIISFIGPITETLGDDAVASEVYSSEDEEDFQIVRLQKWKISLQVTVGKNCFITGKLIFVDNVWHIDVLNISCMEDSPLFMAPPPTATVFGNVTNFQPATKILKMNSSDYILKEQRSLFADCDLTAPRFEKLTTFTTGTHVVITGYVRLTEENEVHVTADSLTIMDSRRSTTPTKPLSLKPTGKRSFLHTQLKSASSTVLKFEDGDEPNEKTPTSAKRAKTKK